MKKKKYLAISLFVAALFSCIPASAQFDLSLSPILVQVDLVPGARKYFALHLTNENPEQSVNLIAYTMDLVETREGSYKVADKGEAEFSCADWMTIQDTSFTLGAREAREVRVYITAPPNVFGGRYAAVVFEVVPQAAPAGEKLGAVEYHFRMPAFVEVEVRRFGGLVRKASIADFKIQDVSGREAERKLGEEGLRFIASVKNEGNIHVDGTGTLIIKTKEGRTLRRVPLGGGRGVVIPGATVDFKSLLRKPPVGEYTARAVINFGGLSPSVAEIPLVVTRTKSSTAGSFTASASLALDIKPENLEFKTPTKGFRAATFSLRNAESDTIFVKAHVMDLGYEYDGGLVTLDSSETGRSCRRWTSIDPAAFSVAPGKTAHVRFTLQAPTEGGGGYYACLVFDALLRGKKEGVISTPFQIPVIMSIPPDLDKQGEILDIEVLATAGRPALLTTYFRNTGNVHVKPMGKVWLEKLKEVKTTGEMKYVGKPEYLKVDEFPFEEVMQYILPGGIRRMVAGYQGALEAGKYKALVAVDYGGKEPVTITKEFQVK